MPPSPVWRSVFLPLSFAFATEGAREQAGEQGRHLCDLVVLREGVHGRLHVVHETVARQQDPRRRAGQRRLYFRTRSWKRPV